MKFLIVLFIVLLTSSPIFAQDFLEPKVSEPEMPEPIVKGFITAFKNVDNCVWPVKFIENYYAFTPKPMWVVSVYWVERKVCQVYDIIKLKSEYGGELPSRTFKKILYARWKAGYIDAYDFSDDGMYFVLWEESD